MTANGLASLIFDGALVAILLFATTRMILAERRATSAAAAAPSRAWRAVFLISSGILALRIFIPIAGNLGIEYGALTGIALLLLHLSTRLWSIPRRDVTVALSSLAIAINLGGVVLAVWLTRSSSPDVWLIACAAVLGINAGIAIPALHFAYTSSEKHWANGAPIQPTRKT